MAWIVKLCVLGIHEHNMPTYTGVVKTEGQGSSPMMLGRQENNATFLILKANIVTALAVVILFSKAVLFRVHEYESLFCFFLSNRPQYTISYHIISYYIIPNHISNIKA